MLEAYSTNVTVASGSPVPLNTVSLVKGESVVLTGASTIELASKGIYIIHVDAYGATADAAGLIGLQLVVNNVAQPNAINESYSLSTGAAGTVSVGFEAAVKVPCCCATPTAVTINQVGVGAIWNEVNVVVTKLC